MKIAGISLLIVILLLLCYPLYLWATYIDKTVTEGEEFGFVIGETKEEVYSKAASRLAKLNNKPAYFFIEIESDEENSALFGALPGSRIMVQTLLGPSGYSYLESQDEWKFYFGGAYWNSISLRFCDNSLCEIYRHRQYFELP